jgi:hypothetical protein
VTVTTDVVIVAAAVAYPEYLKYSAYAGHSDRPFRDTSRWMAFYTGGEIKPEVPEILHFEQSVIFSTDEAARRKAMEDATNKRMGDLIEALLGEKRRGEGATHDVALLSPIGDAATFVMAQPIISDKLDHAGKATPVSMGQYRYVRMEQLEAGPRTTHELNL